MGYYQDTQQGPKQAGARLIVGIFLLFLEIFMYILLRPVIVVIVDSIISPFTSVTNLATFGVALGWIVDGSWLILILLTLIVLIILPATSS